MQYEAVIGLEIHAELKTRTKMFCFSQNDPNEEHPNINICPVCMGHPGTLPVINEEAVKKVILTGHALGCTISTFSRFDRKNYFYPDLPKGYQISQYEFPLVTGGRMALEESGKKEIRITRIHLEEDTGRLIHDKASNQTLVDFNRAGVPLMELVTEPDFRSGDEVREFGTELQKILRYIGASDANMEKGEMRVEVNISLRPVGAKEMGTKVEIKNINSFKFAADAVEYEIARQTELLERGEKIIQETRGWNEDKKISVSQRSKEEAHDYRYFPEPDLPPLRFTHDYIEGIRSALPELPREKARRFEEEYAIARETAVLIAREKDIAGFFESVISEITEYGKESVESQKKGVAVAASFFTGEFMRQVKTKDDLASISLTPENFAELMKYVSENKISHIAAKKVLDGMLESGEDPSDAIDRLGLWQMSDSSDLEDIVRHIIEENPNAVRDYKKGKEASLQFLVGQVMKESRGKANPQMVGEIIQAILSSS